MNEQRIIDMMLQLDSTIAKKGTEIVDKLEEIRCGLVDIETINERVKKCLYIIKENTR